MIYKFKSRATGDLIMLGPNGDQMLRILGREPAPQGIVDVDQLGPAIAALRDAVHQAEKPPGDAAADDQDQDDSVRNAVTLRQRLWPVIEMFEQALQAKEPVVWGV
jgi:hypothetical protein